MEQVKTAAIVLAAGHGKRMHSKVAKQYLLLKGEPVVVHALRAFEKAGMDEIILVAGADEVEFCKRNIVEQYGFTRVRQVVAGGKERYDSVRNGLCALKAVGFAEDGIVLIHDGARPLVNGEIIERAVDLPVWHRCRLRIRLRQRMRRDFLQARRTAVPYGRSRHLRHSASV